MNPSIEYIRNTLAVIVDISAFYKNKVDKLTKTPFTGNLINLLNKHNNVPEN